jgi:rubrerythrin
VQSRRDSLDTAKPDDDPFVRVRVVLMNDIESEALRFANGNGRETDIGRQRSGRSATRDVTEEQPAQERNMANDKMRFNRTGASGAPTLFQELQGLQALIDAASRPTGLSAPSDAGEVAQVRSGYAKEAGAPRRTPSATGARARDALALNGGVVFLDKLGERLAFERAGVRLYDALLSKHDAWGSWLGGPRRADIEKLRGEEFDHFMMLQEVLGELGADPTAFAQSANLTSVISKGLPAGLSDGRTNLREGLEAILVAESVDNDCWENLSDLASALGRDDLGARFEEALGKEREHLSLVRRWLAAAKHGAASVGPIASEIASEIVSDLGTAQASRRRMAAGTTRGKGGTQAQSKSGTGKTETTTGTRGAGKGRSTRKPRPENGR